MMKMPSIAGLCDVLLIQASLLSLHRYLAEYRLMTMTMLKFAHKGNLWD